jgi:hypothetical protein
MRNIWILITALFASALVAPFLLMPLGIELKESLPMSLVSYTFIAIMFLVLDFLLNQPHIFEYKNNRRYCKRCGQQQDNFCWSWDWNNSWWEDMGEIHDPDCRCHNHSTYKSLI